MAGLQFPTTNNWLSVTKVVFALWIDGDQKGSKIDQNRSLTSIIGLGNFAVLLNLKLFGQSFGQVESKIMRLIKVPLCTGELN